MTHEESLLIALHSLVRSVLTGNSIEHGYLIVCKALFPGYVLQRRRHTSSADIAKLERICKDIYHLDDIEVSSASCYSACVTAQAFCLSIGVESEIVIGITKQDEKLVGHAWLECELRGRTKIITPGSIDTTIFTETKRLNPEETVTKWMTERATLDIRAAA
jgi:hypothetical protein